MLRKLAVLLLMVAAARVCSADTLILESGKTMKIKSYTVEGSSLRVLLNEKAEMVIPVDWVKTIRFDPEPEPEIAQVEDPALLPDVEYAEMIVAAARKHDVDWKLVAAVMQTESNFNPRAVSPKGAQGLMQLMPATARLYQVKDPYDPEQNIDAGVRYLKMLVGRYGGKLELALAAYNSGQQNVDRFGGIPPFSETRNYVKRVLRLLEGLSS